jgi:hypothetical protein
MGGVSFAKLDPTFRKEFPDFIKNVCASSLEYDLKEINSKKSFRKYEKEVRDHKQDYDNAINCLYNQAIEGRITTTNAAIQKIFGTKKISHNDFSFEEFKKKEKYCKEGFFEEVLQKQKSLKANSKYWETSESVCEPEYFPREDEYKYSSCQVTEMLLAELCGYQHYLEAKMLDDHVGLTGGRNLRYIDDVSDDLNIALEHEQERSRKALKNALLFYAEFEHNYQRHAWLVAINEGLEGVAKRIAFFRDKIYSTFPTKFIDAATK